MVSRAGSPAPMPARPAGALLPSRTRPRRARAAQAGPRTRLGRLEIYPDQPVTVSSFKAPIDATVWVVSDVTHELAAESRFTSALTLDSAG